MFLFEDYQLLKYLIQMRIWLLVVSIILVHLCNSQCPTGYNCTSCLDSSCSTCSANLSICDACATGTYLSNNTCATCPTKCLDCTDNTLCNKCTPGYEATYNDTGDQICVFYWWKWFLIVFGTLLGLVLVGALVWWIRNKLKDEQNTKEVNYEMKTKHENTEHTLKQ